MRSLFLGRNSCGENCLLGLGAVVVESEEAAEDFFAGSGADGVADSIVFGKGFDFVEGMIELEVMPAIGITNGFV